MDGQQGVRRKPLGDRGKSNAPEPGATPAPNGDPDPRGRGEYDPDAGVSEWYEDAPEEAQGATLIELWRIRDLIEADLHEIYGVDVDLDNPLTDSTLTARSWRWFLVRLLGLTTTTRSRAWAALSPPESDPTAAAPPHEGPPSAPYD